MPVKMTPLPGASEPELFVKEIDGFVSAAWEALLQWKVLSSPAPLPNGL